MEEMARVLILEDNLSDVELMECEMQEGGLVYNAKRARTEQEYVHELLAFMPDIILSDYDLPQYNGLSALAEAKARCPDVPFILVTGALEEGRAIEILTSGARDYVMKNRLQRLVPAIRRALAEAAEIRLRRQVEAQLRQTHKELELEVEQRTVELRREIEERKYIAKALQESEARLKKAQQIVHIGDWEWDLATNMIQWSDELYRIYGYEPQAMAPDYSLVLQAMHPKSKDDFLAAIDAALKGERPFEMDYTFFRQDGTTAILHTIGQVIHDHGGAPERMVGIVQEVTTQRQAEEALRESEEKFKSIYDNASDGIMIAYLPDKKFLEANKAICAMLGYTREELLNLDVQAIHPAEALPRAIEDFEMQMRGEKLIGEAMPMRRKDGSVFYADICADAITIGEKQCALGIFRDITDRLNAEETLRKSEKFVKNILDTVDEGFIVLDKDFCILNANKAYCRAVGDKRKDVVGRHCYELSHRISAPCYGAGEECPVYRVFTTGEPSTATHTHIDAEGGTNYVEVKAFPMKNDAGATVAAIETINNITAKRLLEEERLQAEKMAAIGTLAGGIAHDFNNLLQGVFGYITMAKISLEQKERSLAMLEQAEKALHLAVSLTNQLLTFAKGGQPLKKKLNLRNIIEDAVKFALSGSHATYRIIAADGLRMVEADEGQIGQVIHNLILNADQAMPLGGMITITLSNMSTSENVLPPILAARHYVAITVQDCGVGIPDRFLPKIFEPYFTTKEKGSGLGLATSYSIIRNHGGTIEVTSEVGKGTKFSFFLPAVAVELKPAEMEASSASVPTGKVLVMDDEELVRDVAGELIRTLGHEVELAAHGEAALELYRTAMASGRPFDIVILDLTIRGGMGGVETLEKLLAIAPHAKTVVSSGYSDDSLLADHQKHGFLKCLKKPYRLEDLRNVLNSLLA